MRPEVLGKATVRPLSTDYRGPGQCHKLPGGVDPIAMAIFWWLAIASLLDGYHPSHDLILENGTIEKFLQIYLANLLTYSHARRSLRGWGGHTVANQPPPHYCPPFIHLHSPPWNGVRSHSRCGTVIN